MSAKGLMSEVEVMRLRRQVNDLHLQSQERVNRFRQDASTELVRVQTDLAQIEEQLAGRQDVLRRTVLKSPVRGLVPLARSEQPRCTQAPTACSACPSASRIRSR
jgi:adhesin transport system membrane fusion protein